MKQGVFSQKSAGIGILAKNSVMFSAGRQVGQVVERMRCGPCNFIGELAKLNPKP